MDRDGRNLCVTGIRVRDCHLVYEVANVVTIRKNTLTTARSQRVIVNAGLNIGPEDIEVITLTTTAGIRVIVSVIK